MRKPWIVFFILCVVGWAYGAAEESEQISRFERAALSRESAAESYRMEAETFAKDSDYLANTLAPNSTNSRQRVSYVDSAGVKYEKAGDLMVLARRQYQMALTNWTNAEREYRFSEDTEPQAVRALLKTEESRKEAFLCGGVAADYFEAGAAQYGDGDKFEKQGACFTKASLVLEEIAKERTRPVRKRNTGESPAGVMGGGK